MRILAGALLLVLAAAPVSAKDSAPTAYLDIFHPPPVGDFQFDTGCSFGAMLLQTPASFTVDETARAFSFRESESASPGSGIPGPTMASCGDARLELDVPAGTNHIHVRFDADRSLGAASSVARNATQGLTVVDQDGVVLSQSDYFRSGAPPSPRQRFDLPAIHLEPGTTHITITWSFIDQGTPLPGGLFGPTTFRTFNATIWEPEIELSGIPVQPSKVKLVREELGNEVLTDQQVSVPLAAEYVDLGHVNVRVRTADDFKFEYIRLPNGSHYTVEGSFTTGEEYTWRLNRAVQEVRAGEFTQITLSGNVVDQNGPGTYVFVLERHIAPDGVAWLVPINIALLAVPLVLAVFTYGEVRSFRNQAFGGFARSARNLMLALVALVVNYVAFVGAAAYFGWISAMSTLPMRTSAIAAYAIVVLASLAFLALFFVGRELYKITKPAPLLHEV